MSWHIQLSSNTGSRSFDYDINLPSNKIIGLVGPSGSGKTTLLRSIAGLNPVKPGNVSLGNCTFQSSNTFVPVRERNLGFVFQGNNLFPHKSVKHNLAFALEHSAGRPIILTPEEILESLGINEWLDRKPGQLSGGQQQLVALARSLISQPSALLLDEAFNGMDVTKKACAIQLIKNYHRANNNSVIFVTHHLNELMQLADEVLAVDGGKKVFAGSIQEFPEHFAQTSIFANAQVALLNANFVKQEEKYGLWQLAVDEQPLWIPADNHSTASQAQQDQHRVLIDAHSVSISKEAITDFSILNNLAVTITNIEPLGANQQLLHLQLKKQTIKAIITNKSCEHLALEKHMPVYAHIKSVALASDYQWQTDHYDD